LPKLANRLPRPQSRRIGPAAAALHDIFWSRKGGTMQRFKTCLWFDNKAEEAANFYTSIFKNSKITAISRYGDSGPGPKGQVMVVVFELDEQEYMGLNGGPKFKFSEAISIVVNCKNQEEVDYYWEKLLAGGQPQQCGWLKDKFGLSWQIVPTIIGELMSDKDPAKSGRVMKAVMGMVKLDIEAMKRAAEGK
jgi:predicted 3-demethylubiquinone-9 3-methyltransferase (glyoxalase superfamily)